MFIFKNKSTVKCTVIQQYRDIVDSTVGVDIISKPKEGWVRTIRIALDMSGAQLGKKMGFSRNRISVLERKEMDGDITLNQLMELAEQLDCELNYALVPKKTIEEIIDEKATEITSTYIENNYKNMFLEKQNINESAQKRLFIQVKKQIIESGGRKLWNDIKE